MAQERFIRTMPLKDHPTFQLEGKSKHDSGESTEEKSDTSDQDGRVNADKGFNSVKNKTSASEKIINQNATKADVPTTWCI